MRSSTRRLLHRVILVTVPTLVLGSACPKTRRPDGPADAAHDAGVSADSGPARDANHECRPSEGSRCDWETLDGGHRVDASGGDAGLPPREDDAGCQRCSPPILSIGFDESPLGPYTEAHLRRDWRNVRFIVSTEHATIVEEEGDRFVRVRFPEGTYGNRDGGASWQVGLGGSYGELWLTYRVRFGEGFDPVRGGKLPGLVGGEANTGGHVPDGTDGWSARMMWRRELAAVQYVYHPDQPQRHGEDFPWSIGGQRDFVPGTWHTVEHHIVMNEPGERNGIIEGFWDGELAVNVRDIRFRDVDSFAIDGFYFSTFFGGATDEWASVRDETIDFDDFVVSAERRPL
jgi:hypothetical protein